MARGKYHAWITKEGLLKIEGWARDGLTNEQIAHNMGITRETLRVWNNKYSAISAALKRGKEVVDREVENALYKSALGFEYEETKVIKEKDDSGKDRTRVEKTKKFIPPNVTAQIFWLKNRKPAEWRDKQDIDIKQEVQGEVVHKHEQRNEIIQEIISTPELAERIADNYRQRIGESSSGE